MDVVMLTGVGLLTGVTTVLFGFGGGFVAVPVVVWADAALGGDAMRVATATSALVMVVNAGFATAVTPGGCSPRCGAAVLCWSSWRRAPRRARSPRASHRPVRCAGRSSPMSPSPSSISCCVPASCGRPSAAVRARTLPGRCRMLLGAPVGAVAAFLGVGGSVMTVPAMRRAGHPMQVATALANPLTLAIALPATAVSLVTAAVPAATDADVHLLGLIDLRAASALLLGALPVIAVLRHAAAADPRPGPRVGLHRAAHRRDRGDAVRGLTPLVRTRPRTCLIIDLVVKRGRRRGTNWKIRHSRRLARRWAGPAAG